MREHANEQGAYESFVPSMLEEGDNADAHQPSRTFAGFPAVRSEDDPREALTKMTRT